MNILLVKKSSDNGTFQSFKHEEKVDKEEHSPVEGNLKAISSSQVIGRLFIGDCGYFANDPAAKRRRERHGKKSRARKNKKDSSFTGV